MAFLSKYLWSGTSLVAQWLRVHLPMQGIWVPSLLKKLRSPMTGTADLTVANGEPRLCNKRSLHTATREAPMCLNEDPAQPKIIIKNKHKIKTQSY